MRVPSGALTVNVMHFARSFGIYQGWFMIHHVRAALEGVAVMPIGLADRIAALFAALTREEVDALPPAHRERFAALCEHWANFARLRPDGPKSGVLVDLQRRRGRDE
jgi:hypothetical protein